ncbi:protein NEN1-like [Impatiens glandulifera]|uniref:protein NEN1-like n=1 Tax=Impatiens glandulifera TaxID=253017 RepID=UPI001FB0AEB5|nr:protein NEN1-like [Impatiens glandulifera]
MFSGGDDRSEIAFFDVETTVPTRSGQGFSILEFGAILVCPKKLIELENYSTLVHPSDLSHISNLSVRCNGISKEAVSTAPKFADIADKVFDILHGRIWAGHNILRFDCARIRESFSEINRSPPVPKGTIDSLALLTQRFGRRAGDMKMASLASYFGLGQQTHRSLDDVRMNLEVLKYCATVLFLESSLPEIFTEKSWVSPNATTRSRSNGKASSPSFETSPSNQNLSLSSSSVNQRIEENHPILSLVTPNTGEEETINSNAISRADPFDMSQLNYEMERESHHSSDPTWEESTTVSDSSVISNRYFLDFVKPDEISIDSIRANLVPFYRGIQKIQILHKDVPLQICFEKLKVRFGVSARFLDYAGRPRLNFMADADPTICRVLDACDGIVQKLLGENSEWRNVVTRKPGFFNKPTIRLHIPTAEDATGVKWLTEIYEKESPSSSTKRVVFSRFDITEIDLLLTPGSLVDAYFSLEPYDYQQNAGIRLVAKKLIVHSY